MNPDHLGPHSYGFNPFEGNGIVYTCQGGHIDIAHLRIAADHTRYLSRRVYDCLMEGEEEFQFGLRVEPSLYYVQFTYPEGWADLPQEQKERIVAEVSLGLGQWLAYTATTWHEVVVWFGYKTAGIVPEFPSAFSWEDIYSNLLGTILAAQALQDEEHKYNKAMTILLENELKSLGAVSKRDAIEAAERMRGDWFTGNFFVDLKRRNFDIGLDDGFVTPVLSPAMCPDAEPRLYAVPDLSVLDKHNLGMTVEIEPKEWERDKFLSIIYPDGNGKRINPLLHLPRIMAFIEREAVEKYSYNIE